MPKQAATLSLNDLSAGQPCCPPITEYRIPAETAAVLAPAFKALGDPVRLQLMSMIASAPGGEICVCDLTPAFSLSGPTISHHLKTLREAGLVAADRRGTWVYYRAEPVLVRQLAALITVPADTAAG
jgi:ArsR family transcriptional regulator